MTDEPFLGVVQFPHPGSEHPIRDDGWTPWNVGEHRRKFLRLRGRYRDASGTDHAGDLSAWGEWEGPSRLVTRFPKSDKSDTMAVKTEPRALVEPIFPGAARPTAGLQNTDPSIFGDAFRYTFCKQFPARRTRLTGRLLPGSVILFGSRLCGEFALDTVFVVSNISQTHTRHTWRGETAGQVSACYAASTLEPMYADSRVPDEFPFNLYTGATVTDPMHGMFSFVPCMPSTAEARGFRRPFVNLDGITTRNLAQGYRATRLDIEAISDAWHSVVEQVHDAGLCLGFDIAEPIEQAVPDHAWPGADTSGRVRSATC